ncbi:phosphatidate cytidylyltransferase [Albirhodobacter sp. R86504]|uniref:phosphatidate cytidylyltransferase n=1 Tax=Albirhodobacter sp. R86504 TaxID=3093848 RepID=UPI00366A71C6
MARDWSDLRARSLSAVAMIVIGFGAIFLGGFAIKALAIAVSGLMVWELARLCGATDLRARALGGVAALASTAMVFVMIPPSLLAMFLPAMFGMALTAKGSRGIFGFYSVLVMLTGFGLVSLRIGVGIEAVVWLVGVVILCDIGGYFAGRMLGGPKFWPAISPKKTWSGTAAGWICAAIWGFAFGGIGLAIVSIVIAFAGQLGDILESYLKRRAGIKDSSNLIPGHGGVLDRFDALVAAIVALMVLSMIFPLPLPVAAG